MKYNVVVATHHKTGTVWMDGVFRAIADDLGAACVDFKAQYGQLMEALKSPFILLNDDSDFREHSHILDRDDVRILHVIRDPRDVIISAMHYHKKSGERWLHEPATGHDDMSYQQRLKAQPTRFRQYVFEMEHSSANTVHGMLGWRYDRPNCFEARYEDLRRDTQLACWAKIADFLGFDEAEQRLSGRRFWENSLFGGLSRLGNKHVRSGDTGQWKREFTVTLACAFLSRFPGALQSLAYETDHRWVVELQDRPPPHTPMLRRLLDLRRTPFTALAKPVPVPAALKANG